MYPCKKNGDKEIRYKFPKEWLQLSQEQPAEQELFHGTVCQYKYQDPRNPWNDPGKAQVLRLEQTRHGNGTCCKDEECDQSDDEPQFWIALLDMNRAQIATRQEVKDDDHTYDHEAFVQLW